MKLCKILDLVGTDVSGIRADQRSRLADGSLMHEHTAEYGPRMVTMKRVWIKREGGHKWLRWEWDRFTSGIPCDCGFSGIRLDSDQVGEYHLMTEEK